MPKNVQKAGPHGCDQRRCLNGTVTIKVDESEPEELTGNDMRRVAVNTAGDMNFLSCPNKS